MPENQYEEKVNESRMLTGKIAGFSAACRNGSDAPCMGACPYGLDVRDLLQKVRRGSIRAACNILLDTLLFPETLCSICGHACHEACAFETNGSPVDLPGIEKAVLYNAPQKGIRKIRVQPKEEKIAVIGAGLSGTAAAYSLGSMGYFVTLFEKEEKPGGTVKETVPEEIFLPEFESVLGAANVTLITNREITDLAEAREYSGVIVATGKGGRDFGLMQNRKGFVREGSIFVIGECTGSSRQSSVIFGKKAGTAMDRYLKAEEIPDENEMPSPADGREGQNVPASEGETAEKSVPRQKDGIASYPALDRTAAEEEAKRCLMCDCTKCVDVCALMQQYKKTPPRFEIDIPGTLNPVDQVRKRSATRLLMSCDDCRVCEEVCPEKIPTGSVLMQVRTAMAHDRVLPAAFHDFWLRDMEFSCSEAAEVKIRPENGYLYFPGCLLGASDPSAVTGSYALLKKYLPGCGLWLSCCGIPAKWAGESERLAENTKRIRQLWEEYDRPVFLTACPSCKRNIKEFLPKISVRSVYAVLAEHAADFGSGILSGEELAVFDPCSGRFDKEEQESVRTLAKACGGVLRELSDPSDRDGCCGYGGHIFYTNPGLYDRISKRRAEADERPYITYCANCRDVLSDKGKDASHILKVLSEGKRVPALPASLSDRRENRKRLKAVLSGQEYKESEMKLEISQELLYSCDRQLILKSDIEEVIRHCERENRFLLAEDGTHIGHKKTGTATCWVVWKKEGETYRIQNAYSHRMTIEGEQDDR